MSEIGYYRVRLTIKDDERGAIHVSSTLDQTYRLEHSTDDDLGFTDADLVAIRNRGETPQIVKLKAIKIPHYRRVIAQPSRQATRTLCDPELSEVRSECEILIGGGESIMIRSSAFQPVVGRVMPGV